MLWRGYWAMVRSTISACTTRRYITGIEEGIKEQRRESNVVKPRIHCPMLSVEIEYGVIENRREQVG